MEEWQKMIRSFPPQKHITIEDRNYSIHCEVEQNYLVCSIKSKEIITKEVISTYKSYGPRSEIPIKGGNTKEIIILYDMTYWVYPFEIQNEIDMLLEIIREHKDI